MDYGAKDAPNPPYILSRDTPHLTYFLSLSKGSCMAKQFGFSFIEILMSLFFISIMLLGLDAMQLAALRQVKAAYFFSLANQQVLNMAEKFLMLQGRNAEEVILQWKQQTQKLLPQGEGEIISNASQKIITVSWGGYKNPCHHAMVGMQGCVEYQQDLLR